MFFSSLNHAGLCLTGFWKKSVWNSPTDVIKLENLLQRRSGNKCWWQGLMWPTKLDETLVTKKQKRSIAAAFNCKLLFLSFQLRQHYLILLNHELVYLSSRVRVHETKTKLTHTCYYYVLLAHNPTFQKMIVSGFMIIFKKKNKCYVRFQQTTKADWLWAHEDKIHYIIPHMHLIKRKMSGLRNNKWATNANKVPQKGR